MRLKIIKSKMAFIAFCMLCLSNGSFGQKILVEKILVPSGKKLGLISVFGLKSAIGGAGPGNGYGLISSLDVTDIKDDGFVFRNQYKFTKYNNNLEKEWEKEIEKIYGLQAMPRAFSIGNKTGIYFVQIKDNPIFKELHITRFSSKGEVVQIRFDSKKFDGLAGKFINQNGLQLIVYKITPKKSIQYSLISFSSKDLSFKENELQIESNDYEIKESDLLHPELFWNELITLSDRIILYKSYFQDIKGSKKKGFIVKTVEVNFNGKVETIKNYNFESTLLDKVKYGIPTLKLDTIHNELYVFGLIMIESNSSVNGTYISKYDYNSTEIIFKKETEFKYIIEKSNKNSIHLSANSIFPITEFIDATHYLDMPNKELRLLLFNNAKGFMKDKLEMTGVRFDKYGDVTDVANLEYKNNIGTFNDFVLIPEKITNLFKVNNLEYKDNSLDFIYSLSGKMATDNVLCKYFVKTDCSIVVYIKEDDGQIKAFKIEK